MADDEDLASLLVAALGAVPDAVVVTTADLDPPGPRIVFVNRAFSALTGYAADEALGRTPRLLQGPDTDRGVLGRLRATLAAGSAVEGEAVNYRKDGTAFVLHWHIAPLADDGGRVAGFVATQRDVTAARVASERLARLALHDALTGLANRALALDRLALAQARAQRHRGHVAVLFCDLDGFKAVNDALGHAGGDAVLVAVAARLRHALRPEDTAARWGGDEFVAVCGDLGPDEAAARAQVAAIARRIEEAIAVPVGVDGDEIRVAASVGVAVARGAERSPEALVAEADAAMYRAKGRS